MDYLQCDYTEKEWSAIQEVAVRVNISDEKTIKHFGRAAQESLYMLLSDLFKLYEPRKTDRLAEAVDETLSLLHRFDVDNKKTCKLVNLFRKNKDTSDLLLRKTQETSFMQEKLSEVLESSHLEQIKIGEHLSQILDRCLDCEKMIQMYICAGNLKLARERETTLANLREIAKRTELPHDHSSAQNFDAICSSFEKRLHKLEELADLNKKTQPLIEELKKGNCVYSEKLHEVLLGELALWRRSISEQKFGDNFTLMEALDEMLQVQASFNQRNIMAHEKLQQIYNTICNKFMEGSI